MPTYEYRCPEGHEFEEFQRMSDPPVATCPTCGAAAERQLSGGAGLHFKGSGFYITDYRSDAYKKAAAKEGGGGKEKAEGGKEKGGEGGKEKGGEGGSSSGTSGGTSSGKGGESGAGKGGGSSSGASGGSSSGGAEKG